MGWMILWGHRLVLRWRKVNKWCYTSSIMLKTIVLVRSTDTSSSHQLPHVDVETRVESHDLVLSQLVGAILKVDWFVCWHLGPITRMMQQIWVVLIFRILKHKTQELSSILKKLFDPLTHKGQSEEEGIPFPSPFSQGDMKVHRMIFREELTV